MLTSMTRFHSASSEKGSKARRWITALETGMSTLPNSRGRAVTHDLHLGAVKTSSAK